MYISITIYLLFLFTELYVFYYVYIVFSILLTVYSCVFFPLKISDYKKVISIFLTLICYLGINFFSTTLLARKSTNSNSFILDLIYYESIKKTYEIIKYTEYYISHQNIITDLESEYYNDGNLDKLNLLNNQIDLLLLKKDDIEKYNNEIIFKRNKKELHTLIEIIELEEKIKRGINNYTYISPEYKKALKQNEDRLKMLSDKIENIKVKYSNEYLQIEDEILSITTELNEISTSLKITHFIQKQVDINHQALKEINRCNILIEEKVKLLNEQTKNTMDYWEKRSRFLF